MKQWEKYLKSLPGSEQLKLIMVIQKLLAHQREQLDMKPLQGKKGWWRCRSGKLRILLSIQGQTIMIEYL